jgi:hypothetical protein
MTASNTGNKITFYKEALDGADPLSWADTHTISFKITL